MDPSTRDSIFRLIETADNFVKYAKPGGQTRARERATARYREARELAVAAGADELVRIATLRLADLDRQAAAEGAGTPAHTALMVPKAPATSDTAGRVPPGQTLTRGWPVLHEGRIPKFDRESWRFKVWGEVESETELTYDELRALGPLQMRSDFHCVTGWSRLDNTWVGVRAADVLAKASVASGACNVLVHSSGAYTANLPLQTVEREGFLAWGHDGEDLAPEHGWPLRLVVPSRYAWKSAKWAEGLELLAADRRGYWELRGYHNRADPWLDERYAHQEG